jgi:hypothetical protein
MFRRLILGFHHHSSDPAMRKAAELAGRLNLDLLGVFIEDRNLLGLAALPFAREIRSSGGTWHAMAVDELAQEMALASRRAERRFNALARRSGRTAQFEVVQGSLADAVQALSHHDDVIVIIEPSSPADRYAHPFAPLLEAAFRSAAAVLIMPARIARDSGPLVALISRPDDPAAAAAANLAAALGTEAIALNVQAIDWRHLDERMLIIERGTLRDEELSRLAAARRVPVLVIEPAAARPSSAG